MPNESAHLRSPRLRALAADLLAGDEPRAVLRAFWAEVARAGTPLTEPAEDPARRLVTFLWRAPQTAQGGPRNVVVIGGPALWWRLAENTLSVLPGTDVWFTTLEAPSDLRSKYVLSVDDPLEPLPPAGTAAALQRAAHFRPDPLNKDLLVVPAPPGEPAGAERRYSTFALDHATDLAHARRRPGVPTGALTLHRIRSRTLGNSRRVWVWAPPGPPPEQPDVLVLLDGADWVEATGIATTLDNLLADGVIPPVVVALPESLSFGTRTRELCCHRPFADFLADEVVPWLGRRWGAATGPARCAVAGFSYGGLAAAYAGLVRPDRFGTAVSQSGSFWWHPEPEAGPGQTEWLLQTVEATPAVPGRFWLAVGTLEGHWMVPQTHRLRDALRRAGADVAYREFAGGHDLNCWHAELPAALAWATGGGGGRS